MKMQRTFAVIAITACALLAVGWLTRAPYTPAGHDTALLRLSWRLRGEKLEACRQRTQAELDALPVHMRTPEVCESRRVAYRLIVAVDDVADTTIVNPGGARSDRPLFVLHDAPLSPGPHRVRLAFARMDGNGLEVFMDTTIAAAAGVVYLVTMDPNGSHFVPVGWTATP